MRVCVVYDCLFPWTVGGAERWYRNLAERLAADGHEVTYLTRLQWSADDEPQLPGVRVLAVAPPESLYGHDGKRRIGQAIRFGRGVFRHLLGRRGAYDVVHACSFPYFSVLAAASALRGTSTLLAVDWFEVWTDGYWRDYLGPTRGRVGAAVQRWCARVPQQAFVFSERHGARLLDNGLRRPPIRLAGLYAGSDSAATDGGAPRSPLVVFAGRHIAEKRVPSIPPTIAAARERIPGLHAVILGDGPERPSTLAAIGAAGVADIVEAPGFVSADVVAQTLRRATCMLLPSRREGYGMIVIEAAAAGTPAVVVDDPDNAAVELIVDDVNGVVAPSASPAVMADALVRVHEQGADLRRRTAAWFADAAARLNAEASILRVQEAYVASARR